MVQDRRGELDHTAGDSIQYLSMTIDNEAGGLPPVQGVWKAWEWGSDSVGEPVVLAGAGIGLDPPWGAELPPPRHLEETLCPWLGTPRPPVGEEHSTWLSVTPRNGQVH